MQTLTPTNAGSFLRKYGGVESVAVNERIAGVKMGIYGPGGGGKTTLIGTLCDSDFGWPVAYLNARGNPEVISSKGDKVQIFDVPNFAYLEKFRQDLLKDPNMPFKSIVIDNLSEVWSIDLRDRYGATADIDWTKHALTTADILQVVRNYCDLADSRLGVNVFFVMWETPETRTLNFKEVNRSELAFNKALQSQIPGIINWLGRLYIVEEKPPYTRKLDCRPIESLHVAKHQVDPADELVSQIPMEQFSPSLGDMLDTIKGRRPFPVAKHSRGVPAK